KLPRRVPLVVVPTSYSGVHEVRLADAGVNMVIYANHLIRAIYPQMSRVTQSILRHSRAHEAEPMLASIGETLSIIPENIAWSILATDRKSTRLNSSHVSISYAVCC